MNWKLSDPTALLSEVRRDLSRLRERERAIAEACGEALLNGAPDIEVLHEKRRAVREEIEDHLAAFALLEAATRRLRETQTLSQSEG